MEEKLKIVEDTLKDLTNGEYPQVKLKFKANKAAKRQRQVKGPDPQSQTYGVIHANGLQWLLSTCHQEGRMFVDMGSGVENLVVVAAWVGLQVAGIELNPRYYSISVDLFEAMKEECGEMDEKVVLGNMLDWRVVPTWVLGRYLGT
eukprot:SAG11_NODE_1701_length_4423_cov_2.759713_1_plen_146_part_00